MWWFLGGLFVASLLTETTVITYDVPEIQKEKTKKKEKKFKYNPNMAIEDSRERIIIGSRTNT